MIAGFPRSGSLADLRHFVPFAVCPAEPGVRFFLVEGLRLRIDAQLLAGAPRDVAGVAHHAADMALADFLVQVAVRAVPMFDEGIEKGMSQQQDEN